MKNFGEMKNEELGMKNWYAVVGKFIIRNS